MKAATPNHTSGFKNEDVQSEFSMLLSKIFQGKLVPVTMALHILRLEMKEWPPIWRAATNILNKQLRTADTG